MPKQNGSGNSNDGHTARRAFAKCEQLSSITGFDETLLNKLHVIIVAISCNHYINSEKFRIFCEKRLTYICINIRGTQRHQQFTKY